MDYDRLANNFAMLAEIPKADALAIIFSVADALSEREQSS